MKLSAAVGSLQSSELGFRLVNLAVKEDIYHGLPVQIPEDWKDYELPKVMSDLPQEISGYVGHMNESDQLIGCNDCFTADVMSHNKWPNISNDAKRRGFKARSPDSHAPTRGHVRSILYLNFAPVGIHGDVRVICLGPDGLFLQPSLNAAVRTVINLLVATKRFDKDVARCLIMTSVIVVDSVFSEGFSNWHAKNEDDFIEVAVNTHAWAKEITIDCIINKCPNLIGVIGMGKYPFTAMDWMRTELEDRKIYVSHRKLGHPQLIFLIWYTYGMRVNLLDEYSELLQLFGVTVPSPLSLTIQDFCLHISFAKELKGMSDIEKENLPQYVKDLIAKLAEGDDVDDDTPDYIKDEFEFGNTGKSSYAIVNEYLDIEFDPNQHDELPFEFINKSGVCTIVNSSMTTLLKHDIIISVNELNLKSKSTKIYSTWLALFAGLLTVNEIMLLKIFRRNADDLPDDIWRDNLLGIDEIMIVIDANDYDAELWSWNEIIVKTTDTILQVKMKIEHLLDIPIHKQQLLSKTDTSVLELKILIDDKTLAEYGRTKNGMRLKLNIIGDNELADNIEEMPRGVEVEMEEDAMEVEV